MLTRRNLVHIAREPLQLSDVTIQPVLFTLLFVYVFGSGVVLPAGATYAEFAVAGLLLLNLTTSAIGTAVGLSSDLTTGVIDRFRALPMWRPAVLVGRTVSDLLSAALCVAIVAVTGLCIGWRVDTNVASVVAAFGILLLFAYALSWACACLGIVSKGPESAQSVGLIILFPLAIVSNALVPTQRMPLWLRTSPTGTRSAPWPRPPGRSSATPTPRPGSTPGRWSTRCGRRSSGRWPSWPWPRHWP